MSPSTAELVVAVIPLFILACVYGLYRWLRLEACPARLVQFHSSKAKTGPIAHRASQPENTIAGIRRSKTLGASGVEVDVHFTKDGHPVLIHDSTVDRTSDGHGSVSDMTLDELRELDFGIKFGTDYAGERIPTLRESVELCKELDLQIYLEFKGNTWREAQMAANAVKELFTAVPDLHDTVIVMSFWPIMVYVMRRVLPDIMCGLVIEHGLLVDYPDVTEWWKHFFFHKPIDLLYWSVETWFWRILRPGLVASYKEDILSGRFNIDKWRSRGVAVVTWTVNDTDEQSHFRHRVKVPYITDHP